MSFDITLYNTFYMKQPLFQNVMKILCEMILLCQWNDFEQKLNFIFGDNYRLTWLNNNWEANITIVQINQNKCIAATTKNALSVESRSRSICCDNLTMIALSRAASIEYRSTGMIPVVRAKSRHDAKKALFALSGSFGQIMNISSNALIRDIRRYDDTCLFCDMRYSKQHGKWLYLRRNAALVTRRVLVASASSDARAWWCKLIILWIEIRRGVSMPLLIIYKAWRASITLCRICIKCIPILFCRKCNGTICKNLGRLRKTWSFN